MSPSQTESPFFLMDLRNKDNLEEKCKFHSKVKPVHIW